jgi:hypothetical protein
VEDLLDQNTTNNEDDGDLYQILVVRLSYMCDPVHTYIRIRIVYIHIQLYEFYSIVIHIYTDIQVHTQ